MTEEQYYAQLWEDRCAEEAELQAQADHDFELDLMAVLNGDDQFYSLTRYWVISASEAHEGAKHTISMKMTNKQIQRIQDAAQSTQKEFDKKVIANIEAKGDDRADGYTLEYWKRLYDSNPTKTHVLEKAQQRLTTPDWAKAGN